MNRGLMLTRGEPSIQELVDSACGICSGLNTDVQRNLYCLFKPLAKAYQAISKEQIESNAAKKEFYGLRDFYRLAILFSLSQMIKVFIFVTFAIQLDQNVVLYLQISQPDAKQS